MSSKDSRKQGKHELGMEQPEEDIPFCTAQKETQQGPS